MARPLRIEFAGALYHITSRGNERKSIYFDDQDREEFLELFDRVCKRFGWICHAYCLMTNHYHLLVETTNGNLSKGMRQMNGVYTQYVNRRHTRVGHLFQGRYKAILVQKEDYLLELSRYVVLNPVRAGMVDRPGEWKWSSYLPMTGQDVIPPFLFVDWILSAFGENRATAVIKYKTFVANGIQAPDPWGNLINQVYLGSESFVKDMLGKLDPEQPLKEIPKLQQRAPPKKLSWYENECNSRDQALVRAYADGHYSMTEIGEYFGVGRMTVSRAVKKYGK